MDMKMEKDNYNYFYKIFDPKTPAAKALMPLLDSMQWQGEKTDIIEALCTEYEEMDTDGLIETMANLKFKHSRKNRVKGKKIDSRELPMLIVSNKIYFLVLKVDSKGALVFDAINGKYISVELREIKGTAYSFKYSEEMKDLLIHQQNNWFGKLMFRFKNSLKSLGLLTLIMTLLDLVIPLLIMLIYDQIANNNDRRTLLIIFVGVLVYTLTSNALAQIRASILNYISNRMGDIISHQTFTRLMYLSPSYTETASINSQINRIKDFENLKRFVTSGIFINLLELSFSSIYIIAIFVMAGWVGIIPIITLFIVIIIGYIMRPFHRVKMERRVESASERQQNLIELLKNTEEIKISGQKEYWLSRYKKITAENIFENYQLKDYVNKSNNISYFITNASVLAVIYGGVLQVFNGRMSMGALIGVMLIYWKVLKSIRGAFSLIVQVNGLKKSIKQINRFMKLPQDTSLKTNMSITKGIRGRVRFSDVSIRYNKESRPALQKINFTAEPGTILGISGHDGSGKSTILKLILNMYKAQGGRILLDRVNIKQLEPLSLRKSISYAPEKDMIFTGSIRENFRYYNPMISDEHILELIEKTKLSKYMEIFEYNLDTCLSDSELANTSMAFKKLFNITRMLARNSKLYLVDEPESYLSNDEIENIMDIFKEIADEDKATIIISTKSQKILENCSQVITLNQGKVVKNDITKSGRSEMANENQ
jgi:ATP-binding cassette subfamily C protein/ATP-binding cassette subfamily C protein LapB